MALHHRLQARQVLYCRMVFQQQIEYRHEVGLAGAERPVQVGSLALATRRGKHRLEERQCIAKGIG